MKKNEVLKLVKIIFYGLAIVSLALSILGKVYAVEYEYKEEDYFNSCLEYFVELYGGDETLLNTLKTHLNYNMDFTFLEKDVVTFPSGNIKYCVIFTDSNQSVCYPLSRSRSSSLSTGLTTNNASVWVDAAYTAGYIPCNMYYLILRSNNQISFYKTYYSGVSGNNTSSWANSRTNTTYYGSSTLILNNEQYCLSYNHYNYGADRQYELYGLPEYQLEQYSTDITELIPFRTYVSDSRLKVGSIVHNGRNELYIDISDFLEDSLASSYNVSDLVLTVDFDGNTVTFDNLDSYIDIYSTDSGYDCLAFIPYTVFGFSDDNSILDITVQLTQVSFSVSALYPNRPTVSEDYYISISYYLKNDLANNVDWDNTNVLEQNNDVIQYDDDNFNDLKDSLYTPDYQQHGTIYNKWHFTDSLPVWEGWETIYNVEVFTFNDTLGAEHTWYRVEQSFGDNVVQFGLSYYIPFRISDWLYDNAISNYYDVLVFENFNGKYEDVNITSPDGYLIFYSDRYFIKKNTLEIGNVHKTLTSVGNQVYTLYDITYKRLTDINGNIQKGFESVLSKDSAIISLLGTVNFNLDRFGNMINNNLGKIVTGVNGLYGSDGRDLTDIYNKFGSLVSNVDLSNTLNTLFVPTYTGFDDTFNSAIDSMGILALPFEVSKDFITASKVEYQPTFKLTFPSFSHDGLTYWNEYNFELDPLSFLSSEWLEFLQYCNALFVIFSVSLLTYKHIFASPVSEESGVL